MKTYCDNSTEIMQRSNRHRKIKSVNTCVALVTLIITIVGMIVNLVDTGYGYIFDIHLTIAYSANVTITLISLLLMSDFANTENAVDIDSAELCLITDDLEETLSIIPGGQTIFLGNYTCEYLLCDVKQTLQFTFFYEYQPPQHSLTKEQPALTDPAHFNTEDNKAKYQARFRLKFAISPRTLTDRGRHILMLDLKNERSLKTSLESWITTGITVKESGNLEIAQQFLDSNPYGFQKMSVKLMAVGRLTGYGLEIV